jgi:Fe-S cluster biogenesis protein NfuA
LSSDPNNLKARVAAVLADEIRPALQLDTGEIEVLNIYDGVVQVRLHGSCGGCPSVLMALLMGIELELRKRFPEIEYLEAVP